MQRDVQFRLAGDWALATDGVQWVLQRRRGPHRWEAVSFVRRSKTTLARCVRDSKLPPDVADQLLEGLPDDFETWHDAFGGRGHHPTGHIAKSLMTGLAALSEGLSPGNDAPICDKRAA